MKSSFASLFESTQSADGTPFAGNALRALRVLRTSDTLYLAIEGTLSGTGRAIVVYLDADVDAGTGELDTGGLADTTGALDASLSVGSLYPAPLRVDGAWGTLDFDRAATANDERMGFRNFANTSAFAIWPGETVCGADVCEAAISLATLGAGAATDVGLFARIVDGTGTVSNQTLPMDSPSAPETVTVYASVSAP